MEQPRSQNHKPTSIKKLDSDFLQDIAAALNEGVNCFKKRGWLQRSGLSLDQHE
jgi:hypothetical protein